MGRIRRIWYRIYSDFLMPSRLDEYRAFLETAIERGYQIHSVRSFLDVARAGLRSDAGHLILRHDIDTDTRTARRMFDVERELDARASYYFRLSTIDIPLMQSIEAYGSEASYHFEELATVAKQKRLRSRADVLHHMGPIRMAFKDNLIALRASTNLPMSTVAAHGDFCNRALKMFSWELLDEDLRKEMQIACEVYDDELDRYVTGRYSDDQYPLFWKPESPAAALARNEPVVYVLTHPRHWHVNIAANVKDNLGRLWEGIRYKGV